MSQWPYWQNMPPTQSCNLPLKGHYSVSQKKISSVIGWVYKIIFLKRPQLWFQRELWIFQMKPTTQISTWFHGLKLHRLKTITFFNHHSRPFFPPLNDFWVVHKTPPAFFSRIHPLLRCDNAATFPTLASRQSGKDLHCQSGEATRDTPDLCGNTFLVCGFNPFEKY